MTNTGTISKVCIIFWAIVVSVIDLGILIINFLSWKGDEWSWGIHYWYAAIVFTIRQVMFIVLIKDGLTKEPDAYTFYTSNLVVAFTVIFSCLLTKSATLLGFQLFVEGAILVITFTVVAYSSVYNKQGNINELQQVIVVPGGGMLLANLEKVPDESGDRF